MSALRPLLVSTATLLCMAFIASLPTPASTIDCYHCGFTIPGDDNAKLQKECSTTDDDPGLLHECPSAVCAKQLHKDGRVQRSCVLRNADQLHLGCVRQTVEGVTTVEWYWDSQGCKVGGVVTSGVVIVAATTAVAILMSS